MRLTAVLMGAMLASVPVNAQAQQGLPSQAMLADMGLSGMQILSDEEAMTIRGTGFSGGVGTAYHFHHSIHKFHKWIHEFHKRVHEFHKSLHHFPKDMKRLHHDLGKKHDFGKKRDGFQIHHVSFKKFSFKKFSRHGSMKRW